MPELCDERLDELLKESACRLATKKPTRPKECSLIAVVPTGPVLHPQPQAQGQKAPTLRDPRPAEEKIKDNAGPGWFGMPKTDPNDPELKRDLQILHMRGTAIDPKRHYKKESLKAKVPRYAHVGRIVEGATEFYSARLTRKERKQNLVDELLSAEKASGKFRSKYEAIQLKKASGRKAFYKNLVERQIKSKGRRHSDRFDDAANISSTAIVALPRKSNATGAACYRHHDSLATVTESLPQHRNNEVRKSPFCSKTMAQRRLANLSRTQSENVTPLDKADDVRFPRSVQALYLQPLRREAEYGIPSCDLQLRSFSLRNLEFFVDFALRAAYYLKLPAFGPVPLPRITERWTVPRSSFIFKKSQENFERITLRRLIQIRDGNPETVQLWLAFLQKHAYYGIGMKANVWDFGRLGLGKSMDAVAEDVATATDSKWEHLGQHRHLDTVENVEAFLARARFNTDSGKREEGKRRFLESQYKQEQALKRKTAAAGTAEAAERS